MSCDDKLLVLWLIKQLLLWTLLRALQVRVSVLRQQRHARVVYVLQVLVSSTSLRHVRVACVMCRQRHARVVHVLQVLDLRWGSDDDWDEWNTDRDLCLREIIECQRLSAGPNFVVRTYVRRCTRSVVVRTYMYVTLDYTYLVNIECLRILFCHCKVHEYIMTSSKF